MSTRWWILLAGLAACAGDDKGGGDTDVAADTDDTPIDTDRPDTDLPADTDPTTCDVVPPATWSAPAWDTNAATALALRARLDHLVSTVMRAAEQGTAEVDELQDLLTPYTAGDPSVADIATPTWDGVVRGSFEEFIELIAAGNQDLVDDQGRWSPGAEGGVFEADLRGVHEGGIEVRQLVDKGLFAGGGLYGWALAQTEGEINPGSVEAIAAAWGGNSALDPAGEKTDSANYTFGMGMHAEMVEALVAAHAYAADEACGAERDAALVAVFRVWERAMFARFLHYAYSAEQLLAAPGSDRDVASALHELAEGLGLGLGFYGLEHPSRGPLAGAGRQISDAQLQAIATLLGVDMAELADTRTGEFVSDPAGFAEAVEAVGVVVTEVYRFTPAELAGFVEPVGG